MEWNINKNASQNKLSDAEERSKILDGIIELELENEESRLKIETPTTNELSSDFICPPSNILHPPSSVVLPEFTEQINSPQSVKKIEKVSIINKNQQDRRLNHKSGNSRSTNVTAMNASTPQLIILQPPSIVTLPECLEQNGSPRSDKKRKTIVGAKNRGRPTKIDDEQNTDAKALRKRKYARKYQRHQRIKRQKAEETLYALYSALKEIDAKNSKYKGILKMIETSVPSFKDMCIKH